MLKLKGVNINVILFQVKIIVAVACDFGFFKWQVVCLCLNGATLQLIFEENLGPVHGLTFDSLSFCNREHYVLLGLSNSQKRVAVLVWVWKNLDLFYSLFEKQFENLCQNLKYAQNNSTFRNEKIYFMKILIEVFKDVVKTL